VDLQTSPARSPGGIPTWLWNVGNSSRSPSSSHAAPSPPGVLVRASSQGSGFTPEAGDLFAACIEEKELVGLADMLPPREMQETLLSLYFAHVHPVFPIIHKAHFLKLYQDM
jgi:hypothetical protein